MTQCLFILQHFIDLTLYKTLLLLSRHTCTEALRSQGFSQSPTPVLRPHSWDTVTNSTNDSKRQNKVQLILTTSYLTPATNHRSET